LLVDLLIVVFEFGVIRIAYVPGTLIGDESQETPRLSPPSPERPMGFF